MAVEVVVALCLDEHISRGEAEQTNDALTAGQISLRKIFTDKLQKILFLL